MDLHKRLEAFEKTSLTPEDRADYDMIDYQIGLALFDTDMAQSWRQSPQSLRGTAGVGAVQSAGAGVCAERRAVSAHHCPAGEDSRFRGYGAAATGAGAADLGDRWRRKRTTAISGWSTRRCGRPFRPSLKAAYDAAAGPALDALRGLNRFLETDLPKRSQGNPDWRLGPDQYATKFKLALATDRTPDQVLADAEGRLKEVRAKMLEISLPLACEVVRGARRP